MTIVYRPDMTTEELREAIDDALLTEIRRLLAPAEAAEEKRILFGTGEPYRLGEPIQTARTGISPRYHHTADMDEDTL